MAAAIAGARAASGRLGVQPGLALAYNGTLRNGSLGVGWGLEGFSAISRCPHKFNRDGFAAQSADDRTDRYCLDGAQLVAGPAQTYGADGAIHFPEFDPRTRVLSFGNNPGGPTYFKVWRSNGLIYSYGTTPRSSVYADARTQLKREWALSRVEDHLGNYMTIDYLNIGPTNIERILKIGDFGTRELVPTRIQYTGFDGPNAAPLKPNRSVVLNYSASRLDRNIAYTHDGHVTLRSRLLKKITSFVGDTMVREYNLLYGDETDQPARNELSRLAYVQECEATVCKPVTHFEYNDDPMQGFQPFEAAIHTGAFVRSQNSLSLLGGFVGTTDFDGDGRDDALYHAFEDVRGHTEKNCIESFGWTKVVDRWHLLRGSTQGLLTQYPGLENFMQGFHTRCHPGTCGVRDFVHSSLDMASFTGESILDWNHDGAYDLLDIGVPRNASTLRYFAGSTGGFLTTTLVTPWPQYAPDCRWRGQELNDGRAEVVGDVDGDGNQDIVEAGVLVKRDPLNPSVTLAPVPRPIDPGASPVDLDGDGVPELARRSLTQPDKLQVENFRADLGTTRRQLLPLSKGFPNIDLNGDGLRDVVRVEVPAKTESGQPELEAWLNVGGSFVQIPSLVLPESQDGYTPVIMDVDHDGHDDFLLPVARVLPAGSSTAAFNEWRALTLEGSAFVELGTFNADLWPNDGVLGTKTIAKPVRSVKGDFDGDGNLDLALLSQSDEVVVLRGRGVLNNLMRRITDGVGRRIDVSWRAGMNLEAARNCGPLRCETRTGPVVGQHAEAQVIPGSPSARWERYFVYTYGDGRTNPADGKFLGFAKRTISEYDGNGLSTSGFIRATDVDMDNSARASNGLYPLAGRRTHVKVTALGSTSSLMDGRQDQRITDTVFGWGVCSGGQSGIVAWPCLKSKTVTVQDVIDSGAPLVASRDPAGQWISFNTGAFGTYNSVSTVDSTSDVLFDRYGRLTRTDDPDRGVERYLYTPWGELDAYLVGAQNTQIQKYHYDTVGRLDRVSSSREARDETYTYDDAGGPNEIGRLVSTTSHDGSRRDFTYEGPTPFLNRGFVKTVTDTVQSQTMSTTFDYNAVGQVRTVTYPGGSSPFQVEYDYDNGGNVKAVGSPGFSETYWALLEADQGQRSKREGVGAMYTVKQYAALTGRMLGHQTYRAPDGAGGMALSLSYFFDPNGNLSHRSDFTHSPNNVLEVFTPDNLDRLTDATANSTPSFHADYLPNGNIDTLSSISPTQFTYNNPGGQPAHAPDTAGGAQYTYNSSYATGFRQTASGSGVVVSSQSTSYNSRQLPSRIDLGSASNIAFDYHSSGERSRKARSDGSAVYYSGDFERSIAAGGGSIEQKYRVFSPSGQVLEIVRGANDAELSRVYLHADHLGSPVAFTDQAGTVVHEQRFGPFGTVDNPSWQSQNPAVRRVTRGYTGHEHDPETGLVNMRARLYDARIARFTSPDPTVQAPGFSQSWNRYSYAWNNPFAWVDPTGLENDAVDLGTLDPIIIDISMGSTPSDASSVTGADPLAEFFPAAPPSDFPSSEGMPPLVIPQPSQAHAPTAVEQHVQNILNDALADTSCDGSVSSCGPTAGERSLALTSNILNQAGAESPSDRRWRERAAELMAGDRPMTPTIADPLDLIPVMAVVGLGRIAARGVGAARAGGDLASSAAQGARLGRQLAAEEIAGGHAFTKHVVQGGQFPGVRTPGQFAEVIEGVMGNATHVRSLSGGRTAFWRDGVVVIRNPTAVDGGTAFVPSSGFQYFQGLR